MGQLNGTNPAIVLSRIVDSNTASISELEMRQQVGVECHDLNYTIHSLENVHFEIGLGIFTRGRELQSDWMILVNSTKCPKGFDRKKSLDICSCISLLQEHMVSCFLETQLFDRPAEVWVGYDAETEEILAHRNCPLKKCKPEKSVFTLNSTNSNCKSGFSGIICGSCTTNLSTTFGRIACKKCSGSFSALVVVVFVIAGLLLVSAMLYGDLTVNEGTFNGVIFYANVVHIYRSALFGPDHISVITVLIAWLNLDLGIELCFYPGMTFYSQQWLQYLFPAYVLSLAFLLACLNWYTTLGGKIIGNNIGNVIGTLLLLSYSKLLRLVAETLSFTSISSSLDVPQTVWLYDGNVPYMGVKHAILSAVALVTLTCFLIPFTLLMLLEYPLLRHKTQRILVKLKLHKLTHIYQKPYKKSARWWTGMMLLVRVLLVALYQANISKSQGLPFIIIVTLGLCILGTMWNFGSIYRNKYITMIETFHITNLVFLAGWSEYVSSHRNQLILSCVLVTLALLILLATILYHVITKAITVVKKKKRENERGVPEYQHMMGGFECQEANHPSQTYVRVTGDQKPLTEILADEK